MDDALMLRRYESRRARARRCWSVPVRVEARATLASKESTERNREGSRVGIEKVA